MVELFYAEDDTNIAGVVKEYLEQKNFKVVIYNTILEVRQALEIHVPTVILLDWNMPDGRGDSLCQWIRSRWKELPIIFLTVRGDSHDIVSGFQNGADDYVVKPFELSVFKDGCFIHEDPENPVKGFHLNTLASTLATWREVVEKFLIANEEVKKGNVELMKVWTNTELGETWEEDGETIEDEELMKRRENYNCEIPEAVLYLTAGVDTQDDRFEIEVVGWGPEYESWGIRFAALYGDTGNMQDPVWNNLDIFLSQNFEKPDGTKLKIIATCMDSGGHRSNQVYKFCKARFNRRIFAIKGSNDSAAAYIQKPTKNNREQAYLFTIGVDTGKSWLMDRLKLAEPGPGFCHFPREDGRGYDEKYFKGLTSEKKVMRYKMGRPYFAWELKDKGEHRRNEALDCRNYATAAIEITALPLKKPEEPEKKQQTASSPGKKKKRGRRSGGIG